MVLHVELNSWVQAEEHFRNVDQDQGRKHSDREMFNCEFALNLAGIGTLFSCSGHLDGLPAFPYITIIPQRHRPEVIPAVIPATLALPDKSQSIFLFLRLTVLLPELTWKQAR